MNVPSLIVAEAFRPLVMQAGLDSVTAMMACTAGQTMRSVPGRSTVRLPLGDQTLYLKRYTLAYYTWWQRLRGVESEALHEWRMIHTLRAKGFHTATPVACGQQGWSSFVLTQEIPGGIAADKVFQSLEAGRRQPFLDRLADLTRCFHQAGFIHKDFYLSHIFVGGDDLYLIDLQRVRGPGQFHERWRIKDLAQLVYSLERAGATTSELARWLADPRVRARVVALHRRGPKHDVIWDRPGVDPR